MNEKLFDFGVDIPTKITKYTKRFTDLEGFLDEDYDGEHHMLWDNQDECWIHLDDVLCLMEKEYLNIKEENEQLKQELRGMNGLLKSYRETIKHDAELLADASKNGYLPPLNDYVNKDGWICGCCKHFHSGVRDRCDKGNNWVLTEGSCQDFEREIGWGRK